MTQNSAHLRFKAATMTAFESLPDEQEGARVRVRTRVHFQGEDGRSYSAVYSNLHEPEVRRGINRPTEPDHRPHRLAVDSTGRVLTVQYLTDDGWWERDID